MFESPEAIAWFLPGGKRPPSHVTKPARHAFNPPGWRVAGFPCRLGSRKRSPSRRHADQARAAGLPLLVSRMPATMLWGTGSKRNGSIE